MINYDEDGYPVVTDFLHKFYDAQESYDQWDRWFAPDFDPMDQVIPNELITHDDDGHVFRYPL